MLLHPASEIAKYTESLRQCQAVFAKNRKNAEKNEAIA